MNLLTDKEWLEINEIIKEIYACEDIKTLGYTFLSLIRNMVPFKIGSFSLLNEDATVKVESAVTVGEEMISVEEYNEIYFESDFINDVMSYPKSVVFRDCDVVESQEKVKTFFYKNFMMMYNAEYYSGILLKKEGKLFACAASVSYTHLDVYKRQVYKTLDDETTALYSQMWKELKTR